MNIWPISSFVDSFIVLIAVDFNRIVFQRPCVAVAESSCILGGNILLAKEHAVAQSIVHSRLLRYNSRIEFGAVSKSHLHDLES